MLDNMTSVDNDDSILRNLDGGVQPHSLRDVLQLENDEQDEENQVINIIKHSPYVDDVYQLLESKENCFTVLSSNIDSVRAKFDELTAFVVELRQKGFEFSAICLQECHITDSSDISLIHLENYNCLVQSSTCGKKGGLIIYLHEKYNHTLRTDIFTNTPFWEGQFIDISGDRLTKNITIGNIYRPPRNLSDTLAEFHEEMKKTLTCLSKINNEILITGDFNINLLQVHEKNIFNDFFETMVSNSFIPMITLPTRFSNKSGTLIDNIFCRISDFTLQSTSGILTKKFSDHQPYFMCLNTILSNKQNPKFIKCKINSQESVKKVVQELELMNITDKLNLDKNCDPNTNYNLLSKILNEVLNKHMPNKLVRFNKYKHKKHKWVTQGILISIKYRDNLYRRLKKTNHNTAEYTEIKRNLATYNSILKKNIRLAKKKHYDFIFQKYKSNIKKTWSTINDILNRTQRKKSFPEYFVIDGQQITDKIAIANSFNKFFTNIGPDLAKQIEKPKNIDYNKYLNNTYPNDFSFKEVTNHDVEKIIDQLNPKNSCGIDNFSNNILKQLKSPLINPITIMINQSLNTGIFPDYLKIARVIPLYKKDEDYIFSNYRPISILPSISKVFERVIFNQLYDFFQENNLFYEGQFGFRSGHSTELATVDLVNNLIHDMDKGKLPLCIFLDLSKAFDTINHSILIQKLSYYGINGTPLNLMQNYLTNRKQYVDIDGTISDTTLISTGVPQGSILGPLLFIIYINDLSNASELFKYIMYADDTTLYTYLNPKDQNCCIIINKELNLLSEWLKVNELSLNVNKSKFMIFHQPNKSFNVPEILINNILVEHVDNFNFLGLTLDEKLAWNNHITKISSKISRTIGIINKLKHFLPVNTKITLYNSLILPHINYGILAWGFKHNKITKLQKKAVRCMSCSNYNAHSEPILKGLNQLKVEDLFTLAKLKFYYKFVHEKLPTRLLSLPFISNRDIHNHDTRNIRNSGLFINQVDNKFAQESLIFDIPKVINSTDDNILNKIYSHSLKGFSNYVKSFFLNKYTYECTVYDCYICQQNN